MPEGGGSVLTWVYEAQPEVPLRSSERVWSTRSGRIRWICRPSSQDRVCVHPQPHGEVQALETGMYVIGSTYNFCCSHQEREPGLYRQGHHDHNDKLLRWRVVRRTISGVSMN